MELGRIEPTQTKAEPAPPPLQPAPHGIISEMGLRSRLIASVLVIASFFGGLGVWAGFAPLQSGAIAQGSVNVSGQRKTLQHLKGGIVKELKVREGDTVEAGQVLLRLSNTQALAQLQLLRGQIASSLAATSRLIAERDSEGEISFDTEIFTLLGDDAKSQEVTQGQQAIFQSRRQSFLSQKDLTRQRVRQIRAEIGGLSDEIKSQDHQIKLIQEEIKDLSGLLDKGYARKPRLLELRREDAALQGAKDQNTAAIARGRQAIIEAELGLVEIKSRIMNEVVTELRDTQQSIADLKERETASKDILSRIEIRAPVSGRVVNLRIFTNGGVIAPGAAILDIVPENELLVIEARIDPIDIDVVHAGLKAEIRLSAFRADEMPVINGVIENVSPDSLRDQYTGQTYYAARIVLAEGVELPKDKPLYPGMPAEVLIVTGKRTALSYLFDPLARSLSRSLREN